MKTDLIKTIIDLRAIVSYVGEKKQWWNSNFHDSSSKDFLDYIFPKSTNTQFNCSSVSTRNFLDNQVGANYYHLFRLPMSVEELIAKKGVSNGVEQFTSEDDAMSLLTKLADGLSTDGNSGPKNIGSIDQFEKETLQVFAAEYKKAFENNFQVHPYLN
jgi:hypothetical protein